MKRAVAAVLAAAMILALAGCGKKTEGGDYSKYCTLGEYKGIEVTDVEKQEATDEDVEAKVQTLLKSKATLKEVTDRAVKNGDVASIDYKGYVDEVAFEGGEGSYDLEIGSGAFIPGFEDGLIGAKTGETRDVKATFPDPYKNNPDLAGKEAVFTVSVNKIQSYDLPELTDGFIAENTDFDTIEAYRDSLKESIQQEYDTVYKNEMRTAVLASLSEASEFHSLPEDKMKEYTEYWEGYVEAMASYYGYTDDFDGFLEAQNMSKDDYEAWIKGMAEENCRQFLIYTLIAEKENIVVNDEVVQAAIQKDADIYSMDVETFLSTYDIDKEEYYYQELSGRVLDFLVENAKVQ